MPSDPSHPGWNTAQPKLGEWYASFLGQSMLAEIVPPLKSMLQPVCGYQGLQLGRLNGGEDFLAHADLLRRFVLGANEHQASIDVSASVLELPIASDTISLLVMPHTLEFCLDPHQLLREADRVLARDGYLLILGFNPISSWGLVRACRPWQRNAPWNGRFYLPTRIEDWLLLLNFRVVEQRKIFMRPPVTGQGMLMRLAGLEKLQPWFSFFGGAYLILARKQHLLPLVPGLQRWRPRPGLAARKISPSPQGTVQNVCDRQH